MRREGNALCQSAKRSVTSDYYYYYSGILFFCVINLSFQSFFSLKYSQFSWIVGIFFISSLKVRDKMLVFWWFIRFFFFSFPLSPSHFTCIKFQLLLVYCCANYRHRNHKIPLTKYYVYSSLPTLAFEENVPRSRQENSLA